jgi:CDP-diglyceride synthetase
MSGLISRVLVVLIGLPLVLGAAWAGGWWLYALVTAAAVIAVHEFVTMARPLRPLTPAVYVGAALALLGAEKGGVVWLLGGFLSCFVVAFMLNAVATTRAPRLGHRLLGARRRLDRARARPSDPAA